MAAMNLPDFQQLRILAVGDVMLDRYWYGDTGRISPEAPVPVVRIHQNEERPGGAANVAVNLAALGVAVKLAGQVGDDEAADRLRQILQNHQIQHHLISVKGRETITKLRVISRHQQLIRLDFEDAGDTLAMAAASAGERDQGVAARYPALLKDVDLVLISDYAKGTLTDIPLMIEQAVSLGKIVVVDPKGRDFAKYHGVHMITPNLKEFTEVVGACPDEATLVTKAKALRERHRWQALLVTRGDQGMSLITADEVMHLPAHAKEVYDVTGAGDTVIAVLSACMAASMPLPEAVSIANIAASLVVGKLGAASVTPLELQQALHEVHHPPLPGIIDEAGLMLQVASARERGESIVMTNGCFDLLHAGHVQYLQQAAKLGDRLVVAVNDDDSVKKLKGDGRPVNRLADRMEVLAALGCVDWVVPFSEPTPERLICRVLPDILVKGDDYQVHEIAGHQCVQDHGGQTVTLALRKGLSTTEMISRLKGS